VGCRPPTKSRAHNMFPVFSTAVVFLQPEAKRVQGAGEHETPSWLRTLSGLGLFGCRAPVQSKPAFVSGLKAPICCDILKWLAEWLLASLRPCASCSLRVRSHYCPGSKPPGAVGGGHGVLYGPAVMVDVERAVGRSDRESEWRRCDGEANCWKTWQAFVFRAMHPTQMA
jgi:hypothetical protein